MNCIQATAFWSQINAKNVNHLCGLPSLPHVFSLVRYQHPVNVTKLKKDGLRYRSCTPVAVFGDEGKSRNGGQVPESTSGFMSCGVRKGGIMIKTDKRLSLFFGPYRSPRMSSYSKPDGDAFVNESRNWNQFDFMDDGEEEDEEEEEEEDRSLDLLVRFVENVFKKASKRARKAVRSILPHSISTKLVGFAVNGLLILAFLWVLKAFLEVVCTLGSVVFVSILLIRVVWSGVLYLQENRIHRMNGMDDDHPAWTGAQPVS